jgi:hypothetical protein
MARHERRRLHQTVACHIPFERPDPAVTFRCIGMKQRRRNTTPPKLTENVQAQAVEDSGRGRARVV